MKKHIILFFTCFLITYALLINHESNADYEKIYKNDTFVQNASIENAIHRINQIKYLEEEREVLEDTARYVVVYKINRVKRPRLIKYKKVFIRPKFRVQSARSIIGDEEFANI